jgi:hypothetical protein
MQGPVVAFKIFGFHGLTRLGELIRMPCCPHPFSSEPLKYVR